MLPVAPAISGILHSVATLHDQPALPAGIDVSAVAANRNPYATPKDHSLDLDPLTALSPVDGRYADKIVDLRPIFSEFGLIHRRIRVEVAWLNALAEAPGVPEVAALSEGARRYLQDIVTTFGPEEARVVKDIEKETNHDVKAVEYYLKRRLAASPELAPHAEFVHFACTSEDINNVAYGLMMLDARRDVLDPGLREIERRLGELAHRYADVPMLSRTHGQPASPTTLGKEIANVAHRFRAGRRRIAAVPLTAKMNGAVGNYNAHLVAYPDVDWPALSKRVVESMQLDWNPYTIQIEPHDKLAELFDAITAWNVIALDWCQDVWTYISLGYFRQKPVSGEVGSSTMPHKVNPIDFENAEGNLGIANALLRHLAGKLPVSRLQRDLSDSTALRTVGAAWGHTMIAVGSMGKGLGKLSVDRNALQADLDVAWELLAEPVQTVMRRYGLPAPYEQLKSLTRGQAIDRDTLHAFIKGLDLPQEARDSLLRLTPASYLGYAVTLAREWDV